MRKHSMTLRDRVIGTDDGFDCIVAGRRHGTWRSRAEAHAGMAVEQRRQRAERAHFQFRVTYVPWDASTAETCHFDCIEAARTYARKRVADGALTCAGCTLAELLEAPQ